MSPTGVSHVEPVETTTGTAGTAARPAFAEAAAGRLTGKPEGPLTGMPVPRQTPAFIHGLRQSRGAPRAPFQDLPEKPHMARSPKFNELALDRAVDRFWNK